MRGYDLLKLIGNRSFGDVVVARVVAERFREQGRRLPGYGHVVHEPDPRAEIGRAPGLVAHVFEEQSRERPYRDIGWRNVRYDGPRPRDA